MNDAPELGIVLWATDIPALVKFLSQVAGLEVEQSFPGYASLIAGSSRVIVHTDDDAYRGHPWFQALRKEGVARGIGAQLCFRVPDVERAYREAAKLGALGITPPAHLDDGEECQVMGPDGYLFTFWRPLE